MSRRASIRAPPATTHIERSDSPSKKVSEHTSTRLEESGSNTLLCNNCISMANIPHWDSYQLLKGLKGAPSDSWKYPVNGACSKKISLVSTPITCLALDAVLNVIIPNQVGGGTETIYEVGGEEFHKEVKSQLKGLGAQKSFLTMGFNLPAKHVLHYVWSSGADEPGNTNSKRKKSNHVDEQKAHDEAIACYNAALSLAVAHRLRTVALPAIAPSRLIPSEKSISIALNTVRNWLELSDNKQKIDRIVFVATSPEETSAFEANIPLYFPSQGEEEVVITWPWGGYRVQIGAEWTDWQPVDMEFANGEHTHKCNLSPGQHEYKFIIDGEWRYNGEKPICKDNRGNTNNFITI